LIKELLMELHAIGIDLGKTVFHLVGLDSSGNVIVRKRCSRTEGGRTPSWQGGLRLRQRPNTLAQTKPSSQISACNSAADHTYR
jgi:hypothetical protein